MKKLLLYLIVAFTINANALDDKTVTLVVSGQGASQDEARQKAMRSAIEQAFGAFISSNTEIKNDELVKDEIVALSNGNIKEYKILTEYQLPDNNWVTSMECIVSINQLNTYCQNKGMKTDFNGNLFAFNAAQKELSIKNEKKVLEDLVKIVQQSCSNIYNYSITIIDPLQKGGFYVVPTQVNVYINDNYLNIYNLIIKTLQNVSIPKNQIDDFIKSNFALYQFEIMHQNKQNDFGNFHLITSEDETGKQVHNYSFPYYDWAKYYNFKWDTKSMLCTMNKLILVEDKAKDNRLDKAVLFMDNNYNFKNLISLGELFFRSDISYYLNRIIWHINSSMNNYSISISGRNYNIDKEQKISFAIFPFFDPLSGQYKCYPYRYCWNYGNNFQIVDVDFLNYTRDASSNVKYFKILKNTHSRIYILNNIKTGSHIGMVSINLTFDLQDLKHVENISVKPIVQNNLNK